MSAIKKQEEIIEKLQEAVSRYLNEGLFEVAKSYSELLKLACETYRDLQLWSSAEHLKREPKSQAQKLPPRQPSKTFDSSEEDTKEIRANSYISKATLAPQELPLIYQQRMQAEYAYKQPEQQRIVISAYTYGDGADNPKIRASDGVGNWKHEEPNVVITPLQQVIPNKFQQLSQQLSQQSFQQLSQQQTQLFYEDVWADNDNDISFQDPRRNSFYSQ